MRYFYRHVVRRGEVVDDIRGPRPAKTLPVVLSPAEVARFFRAIPSLKQRTILMLAYGAGLRVGEAVQLRLSDIDRERRVIRVSDATAAPKGRCCWWESTRGGSDVICSWSVRRSIKSEFGRDPLHSFRGPES